MLDVEHNHLIFKELSCPHESICTRHLGMCGNTNPARRLTKVYIGSKIEWNWEETETL